MTLIARSSRLSGPRAFAVPVVRELPSAPAAAGGSAW